MRQAKLPIANFKIVKFQLEIAKIEVWAQKLTKYIKSAICEGRQNQSRQNRGITVVPNGKTIEPLKIPKEFQETPKEQLKIL